MTRFLSMALAAALIASPAAAGIIFNYEQVGATVPSDCPPGFPAPPLCNIIDATGTANDVCSSDPTRFDHPPLTNPRTGRSSANWISLKSVRQTW